MKSSDLDAVFDLDKERKSFDRVKQEYSNLIRSESKVVTFAGLDIYRYGTFSFDQQSLIPYVVKSIFDATLMHLSSIESAFCTEPQRDLSLSQAVNTGDGFFVPFDNPLQAMLFCFYFQANLYQFNCLNSNPYLAAIINEPVSVRYAITTGKVVEFDGKYYGPAIINNARILSLDRLNRLLLDHETVEWFRLRTNGIETLQMLDLGELARAKDIVKDPRGKTIIFGLGEEKLRRIKSLNLQKIGVVSVKDEPQDVYSLHAQILMSHGVHIEIDKYVVTIGNLNPQGISG